MASNLSSIGFSVATEDELLALAAELIPRAEIVPVRDGKYARCAMPGGEELWFHLDRDDAMCGVTPYFAGRSLIRVGVVARVDVDGDAFDGALRAWVSPAGDDPEAGDYPFVFELVNACACTDIAIPSIAEARIAAFAQEVELFASEEAFAAAQSEQEGPAFASQSFVPIGSFGGAGSEEESDGAEDDDEMPVATALFTGHVIEAATRTNAHGGARYFWALVETLGARFDVVIDPEHLETAPAPGNVLSGVFWLSATLVSYRRAP